MKQWYQYRCEEIEAKQTDFNALFQTTVGLSRRMKRFLFSKALFGGIRWEFGADWCDWRAVYGSEPT